MKSFEFHSHTADVRMVIQGNSLLQLFEAAFEGMATFTKRGILEEGFFAKTYRLSISAEDRSNLLVDFLSEVLTLSHIHHLVFGKVRFLSFSETALEAEVMGTRVDNFDEDIKAVTYHEALIHEKGGTIFESTIIFDI